MTRVHQIARAAVTPPMLGRLITLHTPENGGRQVVVYVSNAFDPARPARLYTYFHGLGSDVRRTLHMVRDRLAASDPQTIFVFPEAPAAPFSAWMRAPGSLDQLHRNALAAVGASAIASITVAAHSGGGIALANAARSGFRATDVRLIDCAYADWGQTVARWARAQSPPPHLESWFTHHAQAPANNAAMREIDPTIVVHDMGSVGRHEALPAIILGR